ncbi:hypothetical protein Droror1_Dr00016099 [Drosera rotundifolia]
MAEYICRALREGSQEGEQAQALTIKDSIASPFGLHVFDHVLCQLYASILAEKSQFRYTTTTTTTTTTTRNSRPMTRSGEGELSRGIVVLAFSRSPSYYLGLLSELGNQEKMVRIFDCYSDPLGWKRRLAESGVIRCGSEDSEVVNVYRDVRNLDKLLNEVVELGKGLVGQGKDRFCVAIDSVSEMLRHASLSSVAGLLNSLRNHVQVSSTFWMVHSDLHDMQTISALEYASSIVASVESFTGIRNARNVNPEAISLTEQSALKGRFHVRAKRRNGRVKLILEKFEVKEAGIAFMPVSSDGASAVSALLPKVQFNLQLSEKEQIDRSKVVLPFEHQEKTKAEQIYDGRRSLLQSKNDKGSNEKPIVAEVSGRGQILYVRDSDDEPTDSDEDRDDDLEYIMPIGA